MKYKRQLCVEQQHLLRATLCTKEAAHSAWQAWRDTVDFDRLDVASYRLLPMLYSNLQSHGIEDPLMLRLQGIYKRVWVENHLLLKSVGELMQNIEAQGIETTWLGEAPMSCGAFGQKWPRAIAHITIGISPHAWHQTQAIAMNTGWHPPLGLKSWLRSSCRRTTVFFHEDGYTLRLNCQTLTQKSANRKSWPSQQPEYSRQVLSPKAQLRFLLQDSISSRPINQLVLLADVFHLLGSNKDSSCLPAKINLRTIQGGVVT